jgi:hypothetical protein
VLVRKEKARVDKKGHKGHPELDKGNRRGPRADEHYRTSQNISAIAVRVGRADGLGLEALPALWEYGDGEVAYLKKPLQKRA